MPPTTTENMQSTEHLRPFVLVIDHQQTALDEISVILNQAGFGCRCCTTAEEAIAAVSEVLPDLIVCDLNSNGESGLDTYRQIKQQPGLKDVPIMLLSGTQLPDIIRRSHDDDCVYCLRKPPAPKVFVELIDQATNAPVSQ